jgi:DNA-binding NarL/FixJ family response regulator
MKPIKILLCEDEAERRRHLELLLNGFDTFQVVGAFDQGEAAVAQAPALAPEVVLMDIGLPGISGIEATRRIKAEVPQAEVIIYTVYEDDDTLFDALCAGASGYLLKKTRPNRLAEAIQEVMDGGGPLSPAIARKLIQRLRPTCGKERYNLTERECEVLQRLVDAKPIKAIASEVFLTADGVKKVLKKIYDKLQVRCGIGAVAKAVRERIE